MLVSDHTNPLAPALSTSLASLANHHTCNRSNTHARTQVLPCSESYVTGPPARLCVLWRKRSAASLVYQTTGVACAWMKQVRRCSAPACHMPFLPTAHLSHANEGFDHSVTCSLATGSSMHPDSHLSPPGTSGVGLPSRQDLPTMPTLPTMPSMTTVIIGSHCLHNFALQFHPATPRPAQALHHSSGQYGIVTCNPIAGGVPEWPIS
jgi:hypothetical protein